MCLACTAIMFSMRGVLGHWKWWERQIVHFVDPIVLHDPCMEYVLYEVMILMKFKVNLEPYTILMSDT